MPEWPAPVCLDWVDPAAFVPVDPVAVVAVVEPSEALVEVLGFDATLVVGDLELPHATRTTVHSSSSAARDAVVRGFLTADGLDIAMGGYPPPGGSRRGADMIHGLDNPHIRTGRPGAAGQDRPAGRRTPTPMRRALLLATLLACAAPLAACGSSKSSQLRKPLDGPDQGGDRRKHPRASATCTPRSRAPPTVTKEKGATFECLAVATNGQRTTFHVIEVNSHGGVRYSSPPAPLPSVE